jgi:hypothetical protein
VRGQALLIMLVGTALSSLFWAIGEPYWILVAAFAGLVETIPVIGPLAAGGLAVTVGFTSSVHVAVLAAACVLAVRLCEDYLVMPRILGDAVELSPLLVLCSVTMMGILFSGWAVLFAVPLAAVLVTLFDVVLRDVDPADQEVEGAGNSVRLVGMGVGRIVGWSSHASTGCFDTSLEWLCCVAAQTPRTTSSYSSCVTSSRCSAGRSPAELPPSRSDVPGRPSPDASS